MTGKSVEILQSSLLRFLGQIYFLMFWFWDIFNPISHLKDLVHGGGRRGEAVMGLGSTRSEDRLILNA